LLHPKFIKEESYLLCVVDVPRAIKPVSFLEEPSPEAAREAVERGVSEHRCIIIIGACEVSYRGRASSKLELGERVVLIKEDGALLVHRPSEYSPVNWMPPQCLYETRTVGDSLVVKAVRRKPSEAIKITFNRIHAIATLTLTDRGEFSLYASEEEMGEAIKSDPGLIEPDLRLTIVEKKVEPGFIDLYGTDKQGRLVVIEVKRKTAGKRAATQLAKYVEAIKQNTNRKVRGILAAPNISKETKTLLATLNIEFKQLSPRRCAETLDRKRERETLDKYARKIKMD